MFEPLDDRNRLSVYFPKIQKAIPPVFYPDTVFVPLTVDQDVLYAMFDAVEIAGDPPSWMTDFTAAVDAAAQTLGGYPVFFRSDVMSGKHERSTPCRLFGRDAVITSMYSIVEYTEINTWTIQGTDMWAVRELFTVDTNVFAFGADDNLGLPIGKEIRYIVRAGEVEQYFLYWPKHAIHGYARNRAGSFLTNDECDAHIAALGADVALHDAFLRPMTLDVANAVGWDCSIDWMLTTDGWKLIDMATADQSWTPAHDSEPEDQDVDLSGFISPFEPATGTEVSE